MYADDINENLAMLDQLAVPHVQALLVSGRRVCDPLVIHWRRVSRRKETSAIRESADHLFRDSMWAIEHETRGNQSAQSCKSSKSPTAVLQRIRLKLAKTDFLGIKPEQTRPAPSVSGL